jgi:hypothetical protein
MRINHSLILVGGFCPVMVESSKVYYSKNDWEVREGTVLESEYSGMFLKIIDKIGNYPEVRPRIERLQKAMEAFVAKGPEGVTSTKSGEIGAFHNFAGSLETYVSNTLPNENPFITVAKFNALDILAHEIEIVVRGRRWTSWLKFDKFIKNCEAGIKILEAKDKQGVLAAKKGITNPNDDSGKDVSTPSGQNDVSTPSGQNDADYKHDSEYYPYFLRIKGKIPQQALPGVERLYRAMEFFDENSQGKHLKATHDEKAKFEEFAEALKKYAEFDNNQQPTGQMKDEDRFLVANKFKALEFLASEIEIVVGGSTSWYGFKHFITNCGVGIEILGAKNTEEVAKASLKFKKTSSSDSEKNFKNKIVKNKRIRP